MKYCRLFFLMILISACAPVLSAPTVDPNVSLAIAQAQLTGTAQAWGMQQQYWTATAQSWTPTPSLTPVPTATPSITPTPTVDVTATMVVAIADAELTKIVLETERESNTNKAKAWLPYFIAVLALCLAGFIGFIGARRLAMMPTPIHEATGKPIPMINVIDGVVSDIDRAANGMSVMRSNYVRALPAITSDRQDKVTATAQTLDLRSRTKVTDAALDRFMKENAINKPQAPTPAVSSLPIQTSITDDDYNLPLPQWDLMRKWDGTSKPLGFGRNGLILSKAASPHILISGMTGTGKTLFMMRTLAVASLAQGAQVINVGYSDSGFGVFAAHKNYHAVALPKAEAIIECLTQVCQELNERKRLIGGDAVEWEHWHQGEEPPRPFLDLFMDELGNMAEDIYYQNATLNKAMWSLVVRIANEGRKVGIRFVAALQDPTSKSMDLRFRRNCTLVSFRQGDRVQSDTFIGAQGAEHLPVGHFMARTDALTVGGGFNPSDIQILEYLSDRDVPVQPAPKWIEAINQPRIMVDDDPPLILPTQEDIPAVKPVDEIAEMAERIRPQWKSGMSGRAVANLLGLSQYGGSFKTKTDKVIEYLTATTPTATTTPKEPQNSGFAPDFGVVAG